MRPQDFVYDLPVHLIAQQPCRRRDACRLMHLNRRTGGTADHVFSDLPELLRPGDLLVLNDTRVLPAKFFARRHKGGRMEA
ncbi:MAG: S-adenosylmethionine:tRNA ribosyltransferase-isomerase, partial [Planctomycetes bacterium]|nr:S-adenosylmethionine:tRNA ribosyltransferase-isomerase [Planctomycetota bacterium]